jgi:transposase, IS30 family
MGRPPGWVTQKTGRAPMPSPGRPGGSSREQRRQFWLLIAQGLSSERAAESVGVSAPVGSR